jgi:aminoglycoside phosphotransferase (APT) family kinase protein
MTTHRDDAVLQDAVEVRQLSGLSGAQVFLLTKDGRHWVVRKAARDAAASPRLRAQARKQQAFAAAMGDQVRTPNILDEGEVDGRFYFDMEFVRGPDGASYLRRASYGDVAQFATRLCEYLQAAAERDPLPGGNGCGSLFEAIYTKLCDVQRSTGLISPDNLTQLFLALDRVQGLGPLATTLCHGDLTLQNMVIGGDGAIWVVDLLDSPFEHYWQDVAKLHQDLSGGWFLLDQPPVAQCVLDFISGRLLEAVSRLNPGYPQVHELLVASTFVRILPYARTPEEKQFVTQRIDYFARRTQLP